MLSYDTTPGIAIDDDSTDNVMFQENIKVASIDPGFLTNSKQYKAVTQYASAALAYGISKSTIRMNEAQYGQATPIDSSPPALPWYINIAGICDGDLVETQVQAIVDLTFTFYIMFYDRKDLMF